MSTLCQPSIKYHIFIQSKYGYKLVSDFIENEKILGKYDIICDMAIWYNNISRYTGHVETVVKMCRKSAVSQEFDK